MSKLADAANSRRPTAPDLQLPLPFLNGSAGHASAANGTASPLRTPTSGALPSFAGAYLRGKEWHVTAARQQFYSYSGSVPGCQCDSRGRVPCQ